MMMSDDEGLKHESEGVLVDVLGTLHGVWWLFSRGTRTFRPM